MSEKEKVESCRKIVVRWLSSRLEPGPAQQMLRKISNCNVTWRVLEACQKVDPVNECCSRVCQNAIEEAATKVVLRGDGLAGLSYEVLTMIRDKNSAKKALRKIDMAINGTPSSEERSKRCSKTKHSTESQITDEREINRMQCTIQILS